MSEVQNGLTAGMILTRLQSRVSITNAKILLDTAKIQTGPIVVNIQACAQFTFNIVEAFACGICSVNVHQVHANIYQAP